MKNDAKAATEKTTDVKVVAPAKNASNEVKTTDAAAKASDAHVVALNSKVNAGTTSTTPAAAKGSQSKATENKLPQAGTDEKISLFASLAGLSIASLGLGSLGASKKRKND
ncbi:LPXTG cell wall anchor domain-containing protein [Lactobacillus johnsonii]|uniref:LPXTG cell wall anchor domain-containing protein n=1 Tax=Lactobacillus johnsonii TaxID=33959 RepID=UPI0022E5465D|nr:LPXTG cell wall anchor domain-containing protein [Lactobacillus johnsonii]